MTRQIDILKMDNQRLQNEFDDYRTKNSNKIHGDERVARLQALIQKKDNEIKFLRETVRIECEERMGLVAALSKTTAHQPNELTDAPKAFEKSIPYSNSKNDQLTRTDLQKFQLIQVASQRNQRRLAKQSRNK
jgi:hypothetical protein